MFREKLMKQMLATKNVLVGWLIAFRENCEFEFMLMFFGGVLHTECHMDGALLLAVHKSLCWDTEAIQVNSVFPQQPQRHSIKTLKGPFSYKCTSQSLLSSMRSPYTGLLYNGPVSISCYKECVRNRGDSSGNERTNPSGWVLKCCLGMNG